MSCRIPKNASFSRNDGSFNHINSNTGIFKKLTVCELLQPRSLDTTSTEPVDVSLVNMNLSDSIHADAFSRIRVSNPFTIFESFLSDSLGEIDWDIEATGDGKVTHVAVQSTARLTATTGSIIRQSFQRGIYQPGKSQLIYCTGNLGAPTAGVTKRVGYFDEDNGIFLQQTNTTLSWVRRSSTSSSPVDEVINQINWSNDPLDGTGGSGITFDPNKNFLIFIDFAWLGVSRVRVGFIYDGEAIITHEFKHSDLTVPFMARPNQPIRYELTATGTAGQLDQYCGAIISEGGFRSISRVFTVETDPQSLISVTNETPILAVRLKNGFEKSSLIVQNLSLLNTSNNNVYFRLYLRPTLSGVTSWTNTNSLAATEFTVYNSGTNNFSFSNGFLIDSYYVSRDVRAAFLDQDQTAIALSAGISDTTGFVALITAEGVGVTSTVAASMTFREIN